MSQGPVEFQYQIAPKELKEKNQIATSMFDPHGKANSSELVACDEQVIWQDGGNDAYWSVQLLTVGYFCVDG